jgi:hypothetical protein
MSHLCFILNFSECVCPTLELGQSIHHETGIVSNQELIQNLRMLDYHVCKFIHKHKQSSFILLTKSTQEWVNYCLDCMPQLKQMKNEFRFEIISSQYRDSKFENWNTMKMTDILRNPNYFGKNLFVCIGKSSRDVNSLQSAFNVKCVRLPFSQKNYPTILGIQFLSDSNCLSLSSQWETLNAHIGNILDSNIPYYVYTHPKKISKCGCNQCMSTSTSRLETIKESMETVCPIGGKR